MIINPIVDLFAYSLAEGLGDSPQRRADRRDVFASNFPPQLQGLLQKAFDNEAAVRNPKYTLLLKELAAQAENHYPLHNPIIIAEQPLEGYYYPVLLADSYGLLFECWLDSQGTDKSLPVSILPELKKQVIKPLQSPDSRREPLAGDLGKTWTISAWKDPDVGGTAAEIAEGVYQAFMSGEMADATQHTRDWQRRKEGKFLGNSVFEIWRSPQKWEKAEEGLHVIIIIYENRHIPTEDDIALFYDDWLRLWCYRHKILWAYRRSRELKQLLRSGFQEIREAVQTVKQKATLPQLQETLESKLEPFSDYVLHLNELKTQLHTIAINLQNYEKSLTFIQNAGSQIGETELEAIGESFQKDVREIYTEQIGQDYESFAGGVAVIDTIMDTIKGIVEIEQAKRDRSFQNTIGIVGVGLGIGAIAQSSISDYVKENITPQALAKANIKLPEALHPWVQPGFSFSFSLAVVFLCSILTAIAIGWWQGPKGRQGK